MNDEPSVAVWQQSVGDLLDVSIATDGIFEGEVSGQPCATSEGDESDEPRQNIAEIAPGETVLINGVECRVFSTSERRNFGQRGLYALSFDAESLGTVATLYVERNPYKLDVCNGQVYDIDPLEVEPRG